MKRYQITYADNLLGSIVTQLSEDKVETLFNEYVKNNDSIDIEDFVDFLIINDHDKEAERFLFDGEIII